MTELEKKLFALLDRIEVEQGFELSRLRFEIAEEFGYTVELTAMLTSGEMN